ncbi:hypothetical protein I551_2247 [Mycobacterium ulcerans str. Harvey]|uniref:Uncharacterized protein n=1 Tax=Mycobacterium ulcerans str. Harvey TaxID=1299332 RepID=A0ABN0R2U9_MYCUL|nr:hypothetical protein I551_2247 [Mycobacterium ulcerans str. Harvey]
MAAGSAGAGRSEATRASRAGRAGQQPGGAAVAAGPAGEAGRARSAGPAIADQYSAVATARVGSRGPLAPLPINGRFSSAWVGRSPS